MEIKISVITINLNNKIGLEKTIESVVNQSYLNIEYIVIDGNSTDGSKDLLGHSRIHRAISEEDDGIYNAMNKGVNLAQGEYVLFLNSGDVLCCNDTIKYIIEFISRNDNYDIYFGDLIINGKIMKYPDVITLDYLLNRSIPHPAAFIRKSLFEDSENGRYREDYKIVSDWIFFFNAYINQYKYYHINRAITVFDPLGISSKNENNTKERNHALNSLFPNFLQDEVVLNEIKFYKGSRAHQMTKWLINMLKHK